MLEAGHYCACIRACCHVHNAVLALRLFDSMQGRSLTCDPATANLLVAVAASSGRMEQAFAVVEALRSAGMPPNSFTAAAIITAANVKQRGLFSYALRAWELLPAGDPARQRGSPLATSLLEVAEAGMLAAASSQQAQDIMDVLLNMHLAAGDVRLHGVFLQACAKHGNWGRALETLHGMQAAGLPVEVDNYNNAIQACVQAGELDEALAVFERLMAASAATSSGSAAPDAPRAGSLPPLAPNLATLRILLTACHRRGMLEKGLEVMAVLQAAGVGLPGGEPAILEALMHTVDVCTLWDRKALAGAASVAPGVRTLLPHQLRPAPVDRLRLLAVQQQLARSSPAAANSRPAAAEAQGGEHLS